MALTRRRIRKFVSPSLLSDSRCLALKTHHVQQREKEHATRAGRQVPAPSSQYHLHMGGRGHLLPWMCLKESSTGEMFRPAGRSETDCGGAGAVVAVCRFGRFALGRLVAEGNSSLTSSAFPIWP
jgi:hypothetical protein